jgi:hypothetical protein
MDIKLTDNLFDHVSQSFVAYNLYHEPLITNYTSDQYNSSIDHVKYFYHRHNETRYVVLDPQSPHIPTKHTANANYTFLVKMREPTNFDDNPSFFIGDEALYNIEALKSAKMPVRRVYKNKSEVLPQNQWRNIPLSAAYKISSIGNVYIKSNTSIQRFMGDKSFQQLPTYLIFIIVFIVLCVIIGVTHVYIWPFIKNNF